MTGAATRSALLRVLIALSAGGLLPVAAAGEGGLLRRWGLASDYGSQYTVTKRETNWEQTMELTRTGNPLDLSTKLYSKSREDDSRNDYREGLSRLEMRLARQFRFGQAFAEGLARRHWTETTRSRTHLAEDNFFLGQELPFLRRRTTTLGLTFRGGWVQEEEIKHQYRLGVVGDSTRATGWTGKLDLRGTWDPRDHLSWNGTAGYEASTQESQTTHWESDEEGVVTDREAVAATDRGRNLSLRSDLSWTRFERAQVAVSSSYSDGYSQYYQATEKTQETQWITRRTVDVNMEGRATPSLNYAVDYSNTLAEFDYEVQDKDRLERDQRMGMRGEQELRLPLLADALLKGSASVSSGRRVSEGTTAYDTRGRSAEGEVQKPIGKILTLGMRATVDLTQDFYDDASLDKDRLRTDVAFVAAYTPGSRLSANAGYTANTTEVVNIAADRASQNQIQKNYQVTANYSAPLPGHIDLRQSFLIGAAYTYYVYNEEENTLTRTNRVTTKVGVPLWGRAEMSLEHIYNRTDTGAYRYREEGAPRVYTRSTERLRQYLKSAVSYDLSAMIRLEAIETYDLNYRTAVTTSSTTVTDKLTLAGRVSLRREFRNGINLTAAFERTASTQEEDYWDIQAQVTKRFQ